MNFKPVISAILLIDSKFDKLSNFNLRFPTFQQNNFRMFNRCSFPYAAVATKNDNLKNKLKYFLNTKSAMHQTHPIHCT